MENQSVKNIMDAIVEQLGIEENKDLIKSYQEEITKLEASIKHDIDTANGPYKTQFNKVLQRIKDINYNRHYYRFDQIAFFTIRCKKVNKYRELYPHKIKRTPGRHMYFSGGNSIFDNVDEKEWKKIPVTI